MALDGDIAIDVEPCPFCACTTIKHRDDGDTGWLECDWCGATGPYSSEDAAANLTIEQAWNKRISDIDALIEQATLEGEANRIIESGEGDK